MQLVVVNLEAVYDFCRAANVFLGIVVVFSMGLRLATAIKQKQALRYTIHGMIFIGYVLVVSYGSYRAESIGNTATEASVLIFILNCLLVAMNFFADKANPYRRYGDPEQNDDHTIKWDNKNEGK